MGTLRSNSIIPASTPAPMMKASKKSGSTPNLGSLVNVGNNNAMAVSTDSVEGSHSSGTPIPEWLKEHLTSNGLQEFLTLYQAPTERRHASVSAIPTSSPSNSSISDGHTRSKSGGGFNSSSGGGSSLTPKTPTSITTRATDLWSRDPNSDTLLQLSKAPLRELQRLLVLGRDAPQALLFDWEELVRVFLLTFPRYMTRVELLQALHVAFDSAKGLPEQLAVITVLMRWSELDRGRTLWN